MTTNAIADYRSSDANGLLADDFGVGAGGDDADDARAIEVDVDFEVFGFHAEFVELFAVDILVAERFDGDRAGRVSCGTRTEKVCGPFLSQS